MQATNTLRARVGLDEGESTELHVIAGGNLIGGQSPIQLPYHSHAVYVSSRSFMGGVL